MYPGNGGGLGCVEKGMICVFRALLKLLCDPSESVPPVSRDDDHCVYLKGIINLKLIE